MNDILHSLYFTIEWGTQEGGDDRTFDTEFTPRAAQSIQTIKGINPIDGDTIEVYVDYWHFDEGEIADWGALWSSVPWEITDAMEKAVVDGKMSFSRSGATSKNIHWLSLIVPNDANIIKEYLQESKEIGYVPQSLKENNQNSEYYQQRYDSSIKWIEMNNHAVISNGPFYLESYSPESRTIKVNAFDDNSYPFKKGHWAEFEKVQFPLIKKIDMKEIIQKGDELLIKLETENSDSILYFLTNNQGGGTVSKMNTMNGNDITISIPSENTKNLGIGANNIKIFAISNSVLRPDFYESSFIVTDSDVEIPVITYQNVEFSKTESEYWMWLIPVVFVFGILIYLKKRNQSKP